MTINRHNVTIYEYIVRKAFIFKEIQIFTFLYIIDYLTILCYDLLWKKGEYNGKFKKDCLV